jgi:hypothetical protein
VITDLNSISNSSIPDRDIFPKVLEIVKNKTTNDSFGNCHIDISSSTEFVDKAHARAFKKIIPELFNEAIKAKKHILTIKISAKQTRLYKYVLQAGLIFHHANSDFALATKCLEGHELKKCTYPQYYTISFGVTGVVFSEDLSEFLVIEEESGPYLGPKAPTAGVDYTNGEEPLNAVVRKLADEANVKLSSENAILVATAWTNNLRGNNPDANYVYAFKTNPKLHQLKEKEGEIKKTYWISTQKFLSQALPVSPQAQNKSLILKGVVSAALKALTEGRGWTSQSVVWGSGKPATLYSQS